MIYVDLIMKVMYDIWCYDNECYVWYMMLWNWMLCMIYDLMIMKKKYDIWYYVNESFIWYMMIW